MDCSLKFDCMKKELLVIVNHQRHGEVKLQFGTNNSSSAERSNRILSYPPIIQSTLNPFGLRATEQRPHPMRGHCGTCRSGVAHFL